ncbi:hypothetical protein PANDA_001890 [Ailuropoda melanoleuca]|uniref:Uncharacterized protein n=1 Tax=Ailuropoda melanoleuca TaxID=9646 RepID=D2GY52_AILME|nr:hypothetical protein PANDA_001890 [Ailuropoda melanoleuca]
MTCQLADLAAVCQFHERALNENISNYSLVMESDEGTFLPSGLQFTGSEKARAIMEEVMTLLQPVNITQVFRAGEGTDINFWIQAGVPAANSYSCLIHPLVLLLSQAFFDFYRSTQYWRLLITTTNKLVLFFPLAVNLLSTIEATDYLTIADLAHALSITDYRLGVEEGIVHTFGQ